MGTLSRLFTMVAPAQREDLARAARSALPNSIEPTTDARVRLVVNARRMRVRNMDEIIGMCRMLLADGAVDDYEARMLLRCIEGSLYAVDEWPGNVLHRRLIKAMADGRIDPEEEEDLLTIIGQVAGGIPTHQGTPVCGAIPFDDPMPEILYPNRGFVLTGQFVLGTRKHVSSKITERGGIVKDGCSGRTNYLIVGTFGSDEWLHSTHGTKIMKALALRAEGKPISIIQEQRWVESLGSDI